MIILTGKNLGERQRELNTKVQDAAARCVDFNEIKDKSEESDVDKLFKIDLASKYHNIEYIVEVLKSGDSLYISRALKCTWIYGDSFSHVISVENLHDNVIPFMSNKMKKKLLTAISIHVENELRAAIFFKYCFDIKLKTIALKFLNFTNDTFKLEVLNDEAYSGILTLECGTEYLKHFIGLSFTLAEAYVKTFNESNRIEAFKGLSYLYYTVSENKYLDLLEKYVGIISPYNCSYLGLRISKAIVRRHKERVLKKPTLYVGILKQYAVARNSTAEDAKIYATALLPDDVDNFWYQNFCSKYQFFLDRITEGKFQFIKEIFTKKYPNQEFETSAKFYEKQCYKLMTPEEKDVWALQQIASGNEMLGIGNDYLWYKFVSFEKALEGIKKLVMVTKDNTTRANMMLTLIDSAKTHRDVEKLLKHYYQKHVNEQKFLKENFLDRILQNFNVFEFDEDCWTAFNKMFHNLAVYNLTDYNSKSEYRIVALVYHIINQKEVPEAIKKQINSNIQFYILKMNTDKLTKEQREMVFEYLFKFYMDEIKKSENLPYEDEVKYRLRRYIHFILDLLDQYDRTKDDVPELVNKFMKLDWAEFECHRLIREREKIEKVDLFRDLKTDKKLLIEHLPLVKANMHNSYRYNMSTVLKKIKTYFPDDITNEYLKFFDSLLADNELWNRTTQSATHGIFQLGNEKYKVDFMEKYAPIQSRINHDEIDLNLLGVQQAICAHVCYSRPPVPLKTIFLYLKGDYVQYCLPMFHSYLANLPLPQCIEFVEALLDTPISIQKHGIRLAFECFNAESLNTLVLRAWKKTKNVSLRLVIYKAIFNKICQDKSGQDLLFDTLKQLTLSLQPDDDDEVFSLLISGHQPDVLRSQCIEMAWKVVSQFPPIPTNLTRMQDIITTMGANIEIIRQEFVHGIVESFVATIFVEDEATKVGSDRIQVMLDSLIDAKWKLTTTYITYVKDNDDLVKKMELTKRILKICLKDDGTRKRKRAQLKTCFNFIQELESKSYCQEFNRYENINKLMQLVLDTLEENLPIEEIYTKVWEIRLGIVTRKVIVDSKMKYTDQDEINKQEIKDIANNFANELGILLKEFIEKDLFFGTFSSDIQTKIASKTVILKNEIDSRVKFLDMMTNVCLGLMSFETPQINMIVLNLMPSSFSAEYEEEFKAVYKKLIKIDNKEFRCNLFKIFAKSEFDDFPLLY